MEDRFKLDVLLQGLILVLLGPACWASSLGMSVHVVPLDSSGGTTVRAHFSVLARGPCPDVSGVCLEGEDCLVHSSPVAFTGVQPASGWCVRQWQKTVPSDYRALVTLGSRTEFYVLIDAEPKVRGNSGKLNRPAVAALPPPLRARVNCPHHFELAVKDPDGDKVRCRFARADQGECRDCPRHSFIELDEANCMLAFNGRAAAGQYFIHLMVEDFIPTPKQRYTIGQTPLSSVPLHLSLSVEESTSRCSEEPLASDETPSDKSVMYVLPYQEVKFTAVYVSQLESVREIAVIGPPQLYRVASTSSGPLAKLTMAWIRPESNALTTLVPVCFVANTNSFQSEPRCVWLYQRESKTLPEGTELKCEETEMGLVLPLASLSDINLAELQLNSPACPVAYNSTHLTARIQLTGCGTKTVHAGSELVYTNTLQSVRPYTTISRRPSLVLPLACRIPEATLKGPQYAIGMPSEMETFGRFRLWLEFHLPGDGPMGEFTRTTPDEDASRRVRREAGTEVFPAAITVRRRSDSRFEYLDLHVMSNSTIERAQLMVSSCEESETGDFDKTARLLDDGCPMTNGLQEINTTQDMIKIYRLDLNTIKIEGTTMYVQCVVNLCVSTMPSARCPDLCRDSLPRSSLINSVFTSSYTVRSGPVSLVPTTTAPPTTTTLKTTPAKATPGTFAHAPDLSSSTVTAAVLTAVSIFLLNIH